MVSPESKAAATAVAESDTAAVATELDNRDLITTQSVSRYDHLSFILLNYRYVYNSLLGHYLK